MTYTPSKFPRADDLTSANISLSWADSGSSGTTTLTLPRAGHYEISIDARLAVTMTSGTNGYVTCNVGGTAGIAETYTIYLTGSSGSNTPCFSKHAHGDYSANQTVTLSFGTNWRNSGTASGTIHAHFVPTPTVPQ